MTNNDDVILRFISTSDIERFKDNVVDERYRSEVEAWNETVDEFLSFKKEINLSELAEDVITNTDRGLSWTKHDFEDGVKIFLSKIREATK